jgi:hypothetical protein
VIQQDASLGEKRGRKREKGRERERKFLTVRDSLFFREILSSWTQVQLV